jgi:hypothetical protein
MGVCFRDRKAGRCEKEMARMGRSERDGRDLQLKVEYHLGPRVGSQIGGCLDARQRQKASGRYSNLLLLAFHPSLG